MDGFKRRWYLGSFLKTIRKHLGHLPSVSTAKLTCLFHLLLWMHIPQGGSVSHPGSLQNSQFTGITMTITVANTPWTCHVPSALLHTLQRLTQLHCNFVKQILILSLFFTNEETEAGWDLAASERQTSSPALVYHPLFLNVLRWFMFCTQPAHCLDGQFPFSTFFSICLALRFYSSSQILMCT